MSFDDAAFVQAASSGFVPHDAHSVSFNRFDRNFTAPDALRFDIEFETFGTGDAPDFQIIDVTYEFLGDAESAVAFAVFGETRRFRRYGVLRA